MSMSHSLLSFISPIPPGNNQGKAKQKILVSENSDIGLRVAKVIIPGMRHMWKRLGAGRLYDVPVSLFSRVPDP